MFRVGSKGYEKLQEAPQEAHNYPSHYRIRIKRYLHCPRYLMPWKFQNSSVLKQGVSVDSRTYGKSWEFPKLASHFGTPRYKVP